MLTALFLRFLVAASKPPESSAALAREGWSRCGEKELMEFSNEKEIMEFCDDSGPLVAGVEMAREMSCVAVVLLNTIAVT